MTKHDQELAHALGMVMGAYGGYLHLMIEYALKHRQGPETWTETMARAIEWQKGKSYGDMVRALKEGQ